MRKTLYLQQDRVGFLRQLCAEISLAQCQAENDGRQLVVRLNAFSDIPWEHRTYGEIPQQFESVVFYDYTAILSRPLSNPCSNYHLCASWKGENENGPGCIDLLERGYNVAVAFAEPGSFAGNAALKQDIPKRWRLPGSSKVWTCFDGDESDLRAFDPGPTRAGNGRICALRLKSGSTVERDKAIASGFVQVIG